MLAHDMAMGAQGQFLLRIEDIDQSRARPEWEARIYDDLAWLGLAWPRPVMRQSERMAAYDAALDRLWDMGLLYPCTCSRRDIQDAMSAPQEGVPQHGPDGLIYPGTCRRKTPAHHRAHHVTLRLDMARACKMLGPLRFDETGAGPGGEHGRIEIAATDMIAHVGDIVVARRDMGTSYHLSVVVDDAAQKVSQVVRGQDLFEATRIHVVLQNLLDLPVPAYHHHRLIRDEGGRRLAKRDDARAIARYREEGATPADIRRMVGL